MTIKYIAKIGNVEIDIVYDELAGWLLDYNNTIEVFDKLDDLCNFVENELNGEVKARFANFSC